MNKANTLFAISSSFINAHTHMVCTHVNKISKLFLLSQNMQEARRDKQVSSQ